MLKVPSLLSLATCVMMGVVRGGGEGGSRSVGFQGARMVCVCVGGGGGQGVRVAGVGGGGGGVDIVSVAA